MPKYLNSNYRVVTITPRPIVRTVRKEQSPQEEMKKWLLNKG